MQNLFAEHIVCVFPENIISRFDVSVNDVAKEFAKGCNLNIPITIEKMSSSCYNESAKL